MRLQPGYKKLVITGLLATLLSTVSRAEDHACPAPPPLESAGGSNLFTPHQEMDLGDAIAEQFQREFHVVQDETLNAHLQQIGDQILAQLPPSGLQIHFRLVDRPALNAWTLPGGRIYVTRKLVAFANSDDEMAAVLAHELGHALTRQPALDMSEVFRRVLGVASVGDRQDIFNKWHQLQESALKKAPKRGFKQEESEQYIADRVALYALARAGYSPQTFADFWDRMALTQGKAGDWLGDFFGTTKPEERRLREIRHSLAGMPKACLEAAHPQSPETFRTWQKSVIEYAAGERKDALPGLIWKKSLEPPLQSDITQVKFSPDGRWLLAQDDSSIDVLSREPLAPVFRIDAVDAQPAQFTPDSKSIVFLTSEARVEKWSLADKKRTEVHEVVLRDACMQALLSPDGGTLACLTPQISLKLIAVDHGTTYFEKKEFYRPSYFEYLSWMLEAMAGRWVRAVFMEFSPDNHYFAAARGTEMLALDMSQRRPVSLPNHFHELLGGGFAFLGPDRIVGINQFNQRKSQESTFPEGRTLATMELAGNLSPATHGEFIIVRPIDQHAVGVVDPKTGKIFLASDEPALDVYDNVYARGRLDGAVALLDVASHKELAVAKLPRGSLGRAQAGALAADMKWLALSGGSRGAVWDLSTGERAFHLRGFQGAWFSVDDSLYADFPASEVPKKMERTVAVVVPASKQIVGQREIPEKRTWQYGPVLVTLNGEEHDRTTWALLNADLQVKDVRTGNVLWSRHFAREAPQIGVSSSSDRLLAAWPPLSKGGLEELASDSKGKSRSTNKDREAVVEVFELHSGKSLGVLPVPMTGTVKALTALVTGGDWIAVSDAMNRLMIYSISGAQPERHLFGHRPIMSGDGSLVAVENEAGHVEVYDLKTLEKQNEMDFPRPIAFYQFATEGKNLFVVTTDQTAYLMGLNVIQDAKKH